MHFSSLLKRKDGWNSPAERTWEDKNAKPTMGRRRFVLIQRISELQQRNQRQEQRCSHLVQRWRQNDRRSHLLSILFSHR